MTHKTKGRFQPKWKRPYIVETVYSNGAYHFTDPNGDTLMMQINGKFLKKYYPRSCLIHTYGQRSTSPDQVNTTSLIKDSPWSVRWIRIWDLRCLGGHQIRSLAFNGSHHGRLTPEPTEYWWYYDAWCQHWRNDKVENSDFSLITLLMIKLMLHLWSRIHPDQSDRLGFEIPNA